MRGSRAWADAEGGYISIQRREGRWLRDPAAGLAPEEQRALLDAACADDPDLRAVALDEAIQRLQAEEPRLGEIVQLRYYAGLSLEETAGVVGRSVRTITREWRQARAWLAG